jgi:hypothetical protein
MSISRILEIAGLVRIDETQEKGSANLITRMWINQPSTLQPLHKLHGTNVLACEVRPGICRVWFLSGDTISMEAPRNCLSVGWK